MIVASATVLKTKQDLLKKAESKKTKEKVYYCDVKTLHGFQKLGVHNKFVGVHFYVIYAICRTVILRLLDFL